MLKKIKAMIPTRVKQQINANVLVRMAREVAQVGQLASFRIPPWYEWNPWEPNVQVALNDLAKPGGIVFDAGANAGALSIVLSRAVGPRGIVCAFEASPRIVGKCQYNLAANGANNVTLYNYAVYSKSKQFIKIYPGDHLNDSIMKQGNHPEDAPEVETITLDDFSAHYGLSPSLIKMDIEGAEYEALLGSTRILDQSRPYLLLEQQTHDIRCLEFLLQRGYRAIDLANLKEVKGRDDFEPGVGLMNILYIHASRMAGTGYELPIQREKLAELSAADFSGDGTDFVSKPVTLPPGRYYFDNEFEAEGKDNDAHFGLEADGKPVFRYQTFTRYHATSYRDWMVDLKRESEIRIFSHFLRNTSDPTLKWNGSVIYRIPALSKGLYS